MAAVLTTSMTLRIILNIRSSLDHGGSFALSGSSAHNTSRSGGNPAIHGLSNVSGIGAQPTHGGINSVQLRSTNGPVGPNAHTYTLDEMRGKGESGWDGDITEDKSSVGDGKDDLGVKVTVDRDIVIADDRNVYGRK